MRANPHFGLPQSRYFSTTSLTIGRKKPYSRSKRLSYSVKNRANVMDRAASPWKEAMTAARKGESGRENANSR
jgi:hypothetical protein